MFDKKIKELIRSNINKMATWNIDEKTTVYCIIDKYKNTQEDREKFLSLLDKLNLKESIELFGGREKAMFFKIEQKLLSIKKFIEKENIAKKKSTKTVKALIEAMRREIKSKKGIYNIDYQSRLSEIAAKQELTVKNFFHLVKIGVEDILRIKINYRELSKEYLKMKKKWYVNDRILESLRFMDCYALPTASLNKFKRSLIEIFEEKSAYFQYLIELYQSVSPWSFKFSKQPNIIINYFKNIDTLEKAYWLGFLLAEGHIRIRDKNKTFNMGLEALDLDHLIKFCKVIGFDYRKLKFTRTVGKHGQTLKFFSLEFLNTEFCDNLIESGFPENGHTSQNPNLRFPYWLFSDKRFVMAMFLGFFDGDGTHMLKFPKIRNIGDKNLIPIIKIKNRQCLEDIKEYFNIKNEIKQIDNSFQLTLDKKVFNDLLLNYDNSLERKRYEYTIKDSNYRWEISKKLLGEGWSLEEIYLREFGYLYKSSKNFRITFLIEHFKKWFANDPTVKDSDGEVSLRKIVEVYGKLDNNPLVMNDREKIILKRKEDWSVEKIYTKELGYKYDPSIYWLRYAIIRKLRVIFKNDPLINGYEDIIKRIEEVYNPANNL